MRRRIICLAVIITVIMGALAGCGKTPLDRAGEGLTSYEISAELNAEEMTLTASQKTDYVNRGGDTLAELVFNLYPNGFREGAKVPPVLNTDVAQAYPNGMSYGGIEISSARVNGEAAAFSVGGEDQNALIVQLNAELYPAERAAVELEYKVTLPNVNHRFGYGAHTVNLGNWYPVACVYEDGEFKTYPYYASGDPFYSEAANYRVTLTVPEEYTVACSGVSEARTVSGKRVVRATATAARDFAAVLSTGFTVTEGTAGKVKVKYYSYGDAESAASLKAAVSAVETFSAMFGEYPYEQLSVVQADFLQGGMEYPGLIYISGAYTGKQYREIIVHEAAHQWWYAAVGSNEVENAWQDEGLTEYSTALYYRAHPEEGSYTQMVAGTRASYLSYLKLVEGMGLTADTSMNRPLPAFKNDFEYVTMTYGRGQLLFYDLERLIGEERFLAGLRAYYEECRYDIAAPEDMIGAFERASGIALSGWFDSYLSGKAIV